MKLVVSDPFWRENSKLPIDEIEKNFPEKVAAALKMQKLAENQRRIE